ncbi:hypothetical protein LCGC14_0504850 [marine sediment metagenome]|uniref:Uncharacterized protein n=1 Tax=marine sediment metagenome TaxID=412755 RepID=A0A0F9SLA6_9ZZZZ
MSFRKRLKIKQTIGRKIFPYRQQARSKYYENTKLRDRIRDERTTEPLADNFEDYIGNISSKDIPGVDDSIPDGFFVSDFFPTQREVNEAIKEYYISQKIAQAKTERKSQKKAKQKAERDWALIESRQEFIDDLINEDSTFSEVELIGHTAIYDEKNNELVGDITYEYYPFNKHIHIVTGLIYPNYQGLGLYPYLRRELINTVDRNKLTLATRAEPFDPKFASPNLPLSVKREKSQRREELKEHYASYGKKDSVEVSTETDQDPDDVIYIGRFPNE